MAVAADSQFALAFYRLSIAAEWAFRPDLANLAAEGAVRHTDRLSDHDRRLLEALLANRRGDDEQAERMFRAVVETWPQDVEAWIQLGEVQFHYGPLRGRALVESRDEFERVLAFEPDNALALIHLQRIAARVADVTAVDSLSRRILELNPEGDRALEVQALPAVLSGDSAMLAEFRAQLDAAPEIYVPGAIWGVASWSDQLAAGRIVLETETLPARSAALRALGHVHLAYHNAMQGRWTAARAELAAAERLNPALGLAHRAFLQLQPFTPTSRANLEALLDDLTRWDAGHAPPSSIPNVHFSIHDGLYPAIRRYLMGVTHVQLGNHSDAIAIADDLEQAGGDGAESVLARSYARSLRAAVAEAQGDQVAALRALGDQPIPVNYELALFSPLASMVADRFRRATLLDALGRSDEAVQAYRSFEEFSFFSRVFAAPAALRAGRLAERDGRRSDALRHYQRFLFFWSDADPEFRPLVDEAEEALQSLGGRAVGR
jgi:tetratricopeptide (TPR) repeat protein